MKNFLFVFIFTLAAACAATPSIEEAALPAPSLEKIADGVWVHKSYEIIEPWGAILSQGLVIANDDELILVDTAWNDADTKVLLALIESEVGARPAAAILTHAHNDKMGGVHVLRDEGIATYAHPFSNEDAPARGLTPAENNLYASAPLLTHYFPGGGHTRDNTVVYYAAAKVLFGGCLIRPGGSNSLGNTADADVANWADAVRRVAAEFPDAEIIIPSHGPAGGRELLDHTIALAEAAANE